LAEVGRYFRDSAAFGSFAQRYTSAEFPQLDNAKPKAQNPFVRRI